MTDHGATIHPVAPSGEENRRDFLYLATGAMTGVGIGGAVWPFIANMNPAADVVSTATTEVDLASIELGQRISVMWRGRPVFVARRTPDEIQRAQADDASPTLLDPEPDARRAPRPEWLIVVGVCTHLGCIPRGQTPGDPHGAYGGWFCPCHGSVYDASGRVRRGPAPRNLVVPPYRFLHDKRIRIG
ncbi:MAG: ubiquinol-cytochrome c reductase iron-sulfur subunit [Phreatobacter sp.]